MICSLVLLVMFTSKDVRVLLSIKGMLVNIIYVIKDRNLSVRVEICKYMQHQLISILLWVDQVASMVMTM